MTIHDKEKKECCQKHGQNSCQKQDHDSNHHSCSNHAHGEQCSHHHDSNHDHSHCGHDHSHEDSEKFHRYSFTDTELFKYNSMQSNELIQSINEFLDDNFYGKAVPLLESFYQRMNAILPDSPEKEENMLQTKHHLALGYGIIGEPDKSLVLWKDLIKYFKQKQDFDELLEAYHNAALTSEQSSFQDDAGELLSEGLAFALQSNNKNWQAIFEYELGLWNFRNGEFLEAETRFLHFLELSDSSDEESLIIAKMHLGKIAEEKKQMDEAIELYEQALVLCKKESVRDEVEAEKAVLEKRLYSIKNEKLQSKLLTF